MFMFIIPFLALKKKHPIKPTGHDFSKKKKKKLTGHGLYMIHISRDK